MLLLYMRVSTVRSKDEYNRSCNNGGVGRAVVAGGAGPPRFRGSDFCCFSTAAEELED